MIRKFLVVSNQLYLSSTQVEDENNAIVNIDLLMPIEVHWKILELLKHADYLIASKEHSSDIQAIYKQVFAQAVPYAIYENDRGWLSKKSQK